MVTIRRLILELGIDGDIPAQQKLKEFNESANELKRTLEGVEKQLNIVGKFPGLGGISGFGAGGSPLTISEQTEAKERIEAIKEQAREQKNREEKQISLMEKQVSIQEMIVEELDKQIDQQTQLFNRLLQSAQGDIAATKGIVGSSQQALQDLIDFIEPLFAKRNLLGITGPTPRPGSEAEQMRQSLYDFILKPFKDIINELDIFQQELDNTQKEQKDIAKEYENITKLMDSSTAKFRNIIKMIAEDIESKTPVAEITEKIKEEQQKYVSETEVNPFVRAAAQSMQSVTELVEKVKSEGQVQSITQTQLFNMLTGGVAIPQIPKETTSRFTIGSAVSQILQEADIEDIEAIENPKLRRLAIAQAVENKRERQRIQEKIKEIAEEINADFEREAQVEEAGIAFVPFQQKQLKILREKFESAKEKITGFADELREKAISKLTELPIFETPEEFKERRKQEREAKAKELVQQTLEREAVKEGTEGKIYNIVFNDTKVDSEARIDELVKKLELSLRGTL